MWAHVSLCGPGEQQTGRGGARTASGGEPTSPPAGPPGTLSHKPPVDLFSQQWAQGESKNSQVLVEAAACTASAAEPLGSQAVTTWSQCGRTQLQKVGQEPTWAVMPPVCQSWGRAVEPTASRLPLFCTSFYVWSPCCLGAKPNIYFNLLCGCDPPRRQFGWVI